MSDDKREHPLESVFNIEAGSTVSEPIVYADKPTLLDDRKTAIVDPESGEIIERKTTDVAVSDLEKEERVDDLHIDQQLETIHNSALHAFERQSRMAEEADPKFSARNAEVAAQYLNIALNSVNSRIDAKFKRQKIRIAKNTAGSPSTVNNNVIVADRNEVLKAIMGETIDGEATKE